MQELAYDQMETPIGPLLLAADAAGLRFVLFGEGRRPPGPTGNGAETLPL